MTRFPAEWEEQDSVLMVFPHKNSDWASDLKSAQSVFLRIASSICFKQKLILVCDNKEEIKKMFCYHDKISFVEYDTNDTWIRDFGPISVYKENKRVLLDFEFNGWGGKFESSKDNLVTKYLHKNWHFGIDKLIHEDMVLEGGSIESDGTGTLLTTKKCLLNPNRNPHLTQSQIEKKLKDTLGIERILWLENGELLGDDTDAHIDTLARFINPHTIVYSSCDNLDDPHYESLQQMKKELEQFRAYDNKPYVLIPLPIPKAIYKNKQRLPATYANFLIANHVVLLPTYNDPRDKMIVLLFKKLFPTKEIIPINALRLIEEGGSIHCSTMQVIK